MPSLNIGGKSMRLVGAAVLALLAIGTFPFNSRVLSTSPGLFLAALSAALLFFAYKVVAHPKAAAMVDTERPGIPTSRVFAEDSQAKAVVLSALAPPLPAPDSPSKFVVLPSMPDITKAREVSAFVVGERFVTVYDDLKTVSELRDGVHIPLRHIFAASVYRTAIQQMERLFTLEAGEDGTIRFCIFERDGAHAQIGEGGPLLELAVFESAVVNLVCKMSGIPAEAVRKVKP